MAAATTSTIAIAAATGTFATLAKFGVQQAGELLQENGAGSWKGQYAGPEWPFRCDQKPTYVISGGWNLDKSLDGFVVGPGSELRLTKTNDCGNSMMSTASVSKPVLPPRVQTTIALSVPGMPTVTDAEMIAAAAARDAAAAAPTGTAPQQRGMSRAQLEDEFRTCAEAQKHGASTDGDFTASLYWRYLGHGPDANLGYHTARVTNREMSRDRLEDEFRTCAEAREHGASTNGDFTASLYWRYLGHGPDANLDSHTARLSSATQANISPPQQQVAAGPGYELLFDDKVVSGPDAVGYTLDQARENCAWNKKTQPATIQVACRFNGTVL
jgi:hypothetical protein